MKRLERANTCGCLRSLGCNTTSAHTHKMVPIVIDVEVVGLTADASHPDLVEAWILIDQQGCKVYTLLVNPPQKK